MVPDLYLENWISENRVAHSKELKYKVRLCAPVAPLAHGAALSLGHAVLPLGTLAGGKGDKDVERGTRRQKRRGAQWRPKGS